MRLERYEAKAHRDACLGLFDGHVGTAFHRGERAGFAAFLDATADEYFVLLDGPSVVACGGIAFEDEGHTLASVCWTIVARDRQGEGLGGLMADACLNVADHEVRCTAVRLDTAPGTEGFFQRFGFETVEMERDGYGPGMDRLEMRRAVRR